MGIPSALTLFSLPLVYGANFLSNEIFAGQIIDGQLFRLVCSLDSANNPQFTIKITGRAANNSVVFQTAFSKGPAIDGYRMTVAAGLTPETVFFPGYNLLIDEHGIPQVPLVMAYGKGIFISGSSGQGTHVNSTSQSIDLEIVNVMAGGANLVDCTCVETGKI